MKNILIDPSLAPTGFTFTENSRLDPNRWEFRPNLELLYAHTWEEWHRNNALRQIPLEAIVYELMPQFGEAGDPPDEGYEFHGRLYNMRDVLVVSTIIQWFGTNVGQSFLLFDQFSLLWYEDRMAAYRDATLTDDWRLLHSCNAYCRPGVCVPSPSDYPGERDNIAINAMMRWLDRDQGKSFLKTVAEKAALQHMVRKL